MLFLLGWATGFSNVTAQKNVTHSIISQHYSKIRLIHKMRDVVNLRSLSLRKLLASNVSQMTIDEEYARYQQLATDFLLLSEQYNKYSLAVVESQLFQHAMEQANDLQLRQDQQVKKALPRSTENKGLDTLIVSRISSLDEFEFDWQKEQALYAEFSALLSVESELSQQAHKKAEVLYARNLQFLVIIAMLSLILSFMVVHFVVRRETRARAMLVAQKDQVELTFRDTSKNSNLDNLLHWHAAHDGLTGLVNRREFEVLLAQLLQDAKSNRRNHAILYVELEHFNIINDTCGHVAGDALLQQLAVILEAKTRGSDVVSRLGDNQFGFLLNSCSLHKAEDIANALRRIIQEFRFCWKTYVFKLDVSIGVLGVRHNSLSVATLMSDANAACYIAKEKGFNGVWVQRVDDKEIMLRRDEMTLTAGINQALDEGRFSIYKQRIKSTDENAHEDLYELLIRMLDDSGNEILPMAFIPAAERYSMMPDIDRWMIKQVFLRLAESHQDSAESGIVCINLSGQTLSQKMFLDFVVHQIQKTKVNPHRLCFEITETAAIANLQHVTRLISVLRGMGCKFALDDFGSGMSSFTYLRNFTVDFLKIDGSFVCNMNTDSVNRELVKAIHNLGQIMNIKTIAEYVESDEVLQELLDIGVDFAQGYSIHLPEPL